MRIFVARIVDDDQSDDIHAWLSQQGRNTDRTENVIAPGRAHHIADRLLDIARDRAFQCEFVERKVRRIGSAAQLNIDRECLAGNRGCQLDIGIRASRRRQRRSRRTRRSSR